MEDSKLLELLKTLSNKELSRFEDFLLSPFFNKNETLSLLFGYLRRFAPQFRADERLSRAYIFSYLYPNKPYDELFLNSLFSRLLRLLYEFLAQEEWQQQPRKQELSILKQLRQRKVSGKHSNASLKKFQTAKQAKAEFLLESWDQFLLYRELDLSFLSQGGRVYDENLQLKNNALDLLFIAEKLRIACDMLSRNIVVKVSYQPSFLEQLMQFLSSEQAAYLLHEPIIAIYYGILCSIQQPEKEDNYQLLVGLLYEHYGLFCKEELMDMYGYALNYCIKKVNQGKTGFYEDIWKHYLFLVENKIIYLNEFLPAWEYKNIITAALRLKKYEEAQAFAERYKPDLPEDIRENAYNFNMSSIFYSQKQYKKALLMLHDVEFADTTYHLGAKIIQLKSYYELNEADALFSLIDAFSVYLRRNKEISDYRKQVNINFLRIAKKIFQLKQERIFNPRANLSETLKTLRKELDNSADIANKDWLNSILEQFGSTL